MTKRSLEDKAARKEAKKLKKTVWFKDNQISIKDGDTIWAPVLKFKKVDVPQQVLSITKKFKSPTPIQSCTWPIILAKRDLIGIAETGSGKSLAFGIPALAHIYGRDFAQRGRLPKVLVLSPTRELAVQITEQLVEASDEMDCKSICIYGGVPKHEQKQAFKSGVDLVIATPGRLIDLLNEGYCNLNAIDYVVLDEADRLLDLGFEKEVRKILSSTLPSRQVVMYSATWPTSIQKLAAEYLKNPVQVIVGGEWGANIRITQKVEVLDPFDKDSRVHALLEEYHSSRKNRILVFALYKKEASRVESMLQRKGWSCVAIHGDMSQQQRQESFDKFRSGKVPILIATDVAARGLDIKDIEYVVNYTFPLTIEDYVHRIGRCARAGKTGISHTFFTVHDKARSGELVNTLKQAGQEVPEDLMAFGTTVKKKEHGAYGAFYKDIDQDVKPTKITFSDSE